MLLCMSPNCKDQNQDISGYIWIINLSIQLIYQVTSYFYFWSLHWLHVWLVLRTLMPQHADWQEVGAEEKPMPTPDLSDLARLGGKMD